MSSRGSSWSKVGGMGRSERGERSYRPARDGTPPASRFARAVTARCCRRSVSSQRADESAVVAMGGMGDPGTASARARP